MDHKMNEKNWIKDFNEFVEIKSAAVPQEVSQTILARIKKWVHPSPWLVFSKLFGLHAIFGTLSLGVCDQFGLNPFNTKLSLSEYFMTFGHSTCMTLCGVLFISLSVLAAWIFLSREEFLVLKRNGFVQIFSLSFISLAALVAFGAKMTLSLGILWLAGAVIGGMVSAWTLAPKRLSASV